MAGSIRAEFSSLESEGWLGTMLPETGLPRRGHFESGAAHAQSTGCTQSSQRLELSRCWADLQGLPGSLPACVAKMNPADCIAAARKEEPNDNLTNTSGISPRSFFWVRPDAKTHGPPICDQGVCCCLLANKAGVEPCSFAPFLRIALGKFSALKTQEEMSSATECEGSHDGDASWHQQNSPFGW